MKNKPMFSIYLYLFDAQALRQNILNLSLEKIIKFYWNITMSQVEQGTSSENTCYDCRNKFSNFNGGKCKKHKFCRSCVKSNYQCPLCQDLLRFQANQDFPEEAQNDLYPREGNKVVISPPKRHENQKAQSGIKSKEEPVKDMFPQDISSPERAKGPVITAEIQVQAIFQGLQQYNTEQKKNVGMQFSSIDGRLQERNFQLERQLQKMQNKIKQLQNMHQEQKTEQSLLRLKIQQYEEKQKQQTEKRAQLSCNLQFVKGLIDNYYKMLILHFDQINNNCNYSLTIEKIKAVKLLISNFKGIAGQNAQVNSLIVANNQKVERYIQQDIQMFKKEIKNMVIDYDFVSGNSGTRLKVILQKLKLYKEAVGAIEIVQTFQDQIAGKINHFLKTVVSKNISNNKTAKNQFLIIEYLNKFLKFYQQFKEDINIISQKCSESLKLINQHLFQNFKKIEDIYLSLDLGNRQAIKNLHFNKGKTNTMMKMIVNIRVISKNQRYRLHFERHTNRKVNDFKDQINITLITMKNILIKQTNKKETISDYNKNNEYFHCLSKIKDIDTIWEAEQNVYNNFRFNQLFEATKVRNEILKRQKIHFIHQVINQQKFDLQALGFQIEDIIAIEETKSAFICRIKQIFTKKLLKIDRLNNVFPIGIKELDQFKCFYVDLVQLLQIKPSSPLLQNQIMLSSIFSTIEEKVEILLGFLLEKFKHYLEKYNLQQFDQIQKEIKYYINFQQFLKQYFESKYILFQRQIDLILEALKIQKQEPLFGILEKIIQQSKQFIAVILMESSQITTSDYERIKRFRKAFTPKQEELIGIKIDKDIEKRLYQLRYDKWEKCNFSSKQEAQLKQIIEKLPLNQHARYKELISKYRAQADEETNKRLQQMRILLSKQEGYMFDTLLPLIRKEEDMYRAIHAKKIRLVLRNHLNLLLEKQFKTLSKKQEFLETYIYRISRTDQKSLKIKQLLALLQLQVYRQSFQDIPNHINLLLKQFQQTAFITEKALQTTYYLDQLVNFYIYFDKNSEKSFLNKKYRDEFKDLLAKQEEIVKFHLSAIVNSNKNKMQLNDPQLAQVLMTDILKAKILYNLLKKLDTNVEFMSQVETFIELFHKKITQWERCIKNISFDKILNRHFGQIANIIEELKDLDMKGKILNTIESYKQRYAGILSSRVVNLQFNDIKLQDMIKDLQRGWKDFFTLYIKQELAGLFSRNKHLGDKFGNKCIVLIRLKGNFIFSTIKIFDFIENKEYNIKEYIIEQAKKIYQETEKFLNECNVEYSRYIIEINSKKSDTEKESQDKKEKIRKRYEDEIKQINEQILILEQNILQNESQINQKRIDIENIKKAQEKQIQEVQAEHKEKVDKFDSLYHDKIKKLFSDILYNMRILEKLMLQLGFQAIKPNLSNTVDQIFVKIQQSVQTIRNQLIEYIFLQKVNCYLVAGIVKHVIFNDLKIQELNQSYKDQNNVNNVIKNCPQINSLPESQQILITEDYKKYKIEVENIQIKYKENRSQNTLSQIVKRTIAEATIIQTPVLMARIFGIQSILRIKHKQVLNFIRNPHAVQIVGILMLTRPNNNGIDSLTSSMAEVKTGQGKSVVLAGLCCMLALRGFHAYCACYSAYLSQRDRKEYQQLFKILNVNDKIKYGTFADHCKDLLDEKGRFYFKQVIKQCLTNQSQTVDIKYTQYLYRLQRIFEQQGENKRVLIIDEVDVFFQERYFGKYYRPAISLSLPCIKQLIQFIWSHHEQCKIYKMRQKLRQKIKNTTYYKQLITSWSHLTALLDNQIEGMIAAAAAAEDDSRNKIYQFQNKKIIYRFNGIVGQELNNGLKTVFAACLERERNKVSEQFYEKALKLSLIISQFSYAELPRYFKYIIGVSGTLQTLPYSKQEIMKSKYNIQGFYILPSIFQKPQRTIHEPLVVQDNDQTTLLNKILEENLKGRPVMVFFKSKNSLTAFCQSENVKNSLNDYCFLTEDEEENMRNSTIRLAGSKSRVTFMTSYFSRGTDFMIEDKALIEAGGFHVIQTYISKDESDYVQVYGRTARQGKNGSFQMIIKKECLAQFSIPSTTARSQIMHQIKKAWLARDNIEGKKLNDNIQKAATVHDKSYGVIKSLSKGTKSLITEIQRLNHVKVAALKNVRSIIAVDGTVSMEPVLQKLREVIAEAIINTDIIISKKNVNASFQQQIIIYRNYNSLQLILQCSGFSNNSTFLSQWTDRIVPDGGWGNQAIEVAFKTINEIKLLDQVIIIGDAIGNTYQDIQYKRGKSNPNKTYWTDRRIPYVDYPDQQLKTLIKKGIPIHTLYIPNQLPAETKIIAQYFGDISRQTGGSCQESDVQGKEASKILSDLIASSVLKLIGQELFDDYFRMRNG